MIDSVLPTLAVGQISPKRVLASRIIGALALVSEWRRRYRSRRELALYSHYERNDLSFAAEVDAEIQKSFWKK